MTRRPDPTQPQPTPAGGAGSDGPRAAPAQQPDADTPGTPRRIRAGDQQPAGGPQQVIGRRPGEGLPGETRMQFDDAAGEAAESVRRAINENRLPPRHRNVIRRYFDQLDAPPAPQPNGD